MKFDEKITQKHKAALRKLMARGMGYVTKSEIQWELSKTYGFEFDLNYIHKLMREIQEDNRRKVAYLATPEGQAECLKKYQEDMAILDKIEEEIMNS